MRPHFAGIILLLWCSLLLKGQAAAWVVYDLVDKEGHAVQDWMRERVLEISNVKDSVPVYFRIIHYGQRFRRRYHYDYNVVGARLIGVRGAEYFYGMQVPPEGAKIIIREQLRRMWNKGEQLPKFGLREVGKKANGKPKYAWATVGTKEAKSGHNAWPTISVGDPELLCVNLANQPVPPEEKEAAGVFCEVNDDDDDSNGKPDRDDERLARNDDDLLAIRVMHPKAFPTDLEWDDSVIHVYETRNKQFRGGYSARLGANSGRQHYEGYDNEIIYVEGVNPGTTLLTAMGPGGFFDRLKITVGFPRIRIKAENGQDFPPTEMLMGTNVRYKAVLATPLQGRYQWSALSDKVALSNTTAEIVTVWSGSRPSERVGAETLRVSFSPTNSSISFTNAHAFSVVGLQSPLQFRLGTNAWSWVPDPLYVACGTSVDFQVISSPTGIAWPQNTPVWGGEVSGSGMTTTSCLFSVVSTSAADYKLVTATCGPTVTGRVVVVNLGLAVDADRNGAISFPSDSDGQRDNTSSAFPYRFWLNTDEDVSQSGGGVWSDRDPERIPVKTPDCSDSQIQSTRDLEDFSRLHIRLFPDLGSLFDSGNLSLGLRWANVVSNTPAIRLFRALEKDGGWNYIKFTAIASQQVSDKYKDALVDQSQHTILEPTTGVVDFKFKQDDVLDPKNYLIFEGVKKGKGELVLVLIDHNGNELVAGNGVWFDLRNVEELYMRAHSIPARGNFPLPYRQDNPPQFPYAATATGGLMIPPGNEGWQAGFDVNEPRDMNFVSAPDEKKQCIVFVHGVALSVEDVACYTASFYKRLWWEGYRGRLAVYRWSTPLSGFTEDGSLIFSDGEFNSYHSALGLMRYVEFLRRQMAGATVSIAAHSLGNACAGNALRQGMRVDSYVMLEAAMPLACYFPMPANSNDDALRNSYLPELLAADAQTRTPDFLSDQGYRGLFADIRRNIAHNWISYYNDQDFWLATGRTRFFVNVNWVHWNRSFKPYNPAGPRDYVYHSDLPEGHRCLLDLLGINRYRPVEDICEALAFVARSRTRAVGAEPASGNPLPPDADRTVNLRTTYGFSSARPDHSGQFQRDIQLMYSGPTNAYEMPLYRQLISDLNMD